MFKFHYIEKFLINGFKEIISYICIMENNNINLLDLDNDVLNIIGDYVKKDNHDRTEELFKKRMIMYNNTYYPLTKILKIDYGIKNK